jgi:lipoprotein-releasing system ATP-binding protein
MSRLATSRTGSVASSGSTIARPETPPLRVARPAPALRASGIHKSYRRKGIEVPVLKGVDLELAEGCFTAIVGKSGSGKSTLLHLLGTLDAPDRGEIWYEQRRIDNLPARARDRLRNQTIGMIFQFYHLLPELTVLENVLVPQMIGMGWWGWFRQKKQLVARATELLGRVGMTHRLQHRPNQLSGGEMQRTAIARALIAEPSLLLADEPTGNLDEENGQIVLQALLQLCRDEQITLAVVTHDDRIASQADHRIRLVDGRVA